MVKLDAEHEHDWEPSIGWDLSARGVEGEARICKSCRRLAYVRPDGSFDLLDDGKRADYIDSRRDR